MRDRYWHNMAGRIQRAFRNFIRYKQECASRIQRFWKNKKDGLAYVQLRDQGHQVLANRKERRRFSLVSMRQFRGDYLDVSGKSAQSEMLRSACSLGRKWMSQPGCLAGKAHPCLTANEPILFSMNCQLLVSKLMRSSKPMPRYLIVVGPCPSNSRKLCHDCCAFQQTQSAIYIAITQLVQNRPTTTTERKMPLTTLMGVSMSSLRDDWIVCHRGQPVYQAY